MLTEVKFFNPNVGRLSKVTTASGEQEVVPTEAISACYYGREGILLQRKQIPFILCWATTVHKVQDLSLDTAATDLGKRMSLNWKWLG